MKNKSKGSMISKLSDTRYKNIRYKKQEQDNRQYSPLAFLLIPLSRLPPRVLFQVSLHEGLQV